MNAVLQETGSDRTAIRAFPKVNVPESELAEMLAASRRRNGPTVKPSRMHRKAWSLRLFRNSRAIGRRNTTGERSRRR